MKTHEQQDSRNATEGSVPEQAKKGGRRRFLGAGAAATPFVLTLFSQPALGGLCFTPSRALSKNTSLSQAGKNGECTGESPGAYKTQPSKWPQSPTPATKFHPLFSGTAYRNPTTGYVKTLQEVLNLDGQGDPHKVAFHIIGAYLNCVRGLVPSNILTTAAVQNIWTEYTTKGYFEPMAGVQWNGTQIVAYLTSNFIAP